MYSESAKSSDSTVAKKLHGLPYVRSVMKVYIFEVSDEGLPYARSVMKVYHM